MSCVVTNTNNSLYCVLTPAWVIALLVLYLVVLLAFVYVLMLKIDTIATLNWTLLLMLVIVGRVYWQ